MANINTCEFARQHRGTIQDLIGGMTYYGLTVTDTNMSGYYEVSIGNAHFGQMSLEELIEFCSNIVSHDKSNTEDSNRIIRSTSCIISHLLVQALRY